MSRFPVEATALTSNNRQVQIIPSASVTVTDLETDALVTLYASEQGVAEVGNPYTADGNGNFSVWVEARAKVRVRVSGEGTSQTFVVAPTYQDETDATLATKATAYATRADAAAAITTGTIADGSVFMAAGIQYMRDDTVLLADSAFADLSVAGAAYDVPASWPTIGEMIRSSITYADLPFGEAGGASILAGELAFTTAPLAATDQQFTNASGVKIYVAASRNGRLVADVTGIRTDGADTSDQFEALAYLLAARGGGTMELPAGDIMLERTAYVPNGVSIRGASSQPSLGPTGAVVSGQGTRIRTRVGGVYTDGSAIAYNVDSTDSTTWEQQFPNDGPTISDLYFEPDEGSPGENMILLGGSCIIRNIRCKNTASLVKKLGLYIDGITITDVHATDRANDTDYLIDVPGLGDKLYIARIATGYLDGQTGVCKGVRVRGCRGGVVHDLVNGIHEFINCSAMPVHSCHIERGDIIFDNCDGSAFDNFMYRSVHDDGRIIVRGDSDGNKGTMHLSGNAFATVAGWSGGTALLTESADIVIESGGSARLAGNQRKHAISGRVSKNATQGVIVSVPGDGTDNTFNTYRYGLSAGSVLVTDKGPAIAHMLPPSANTFGGLGTPIVETMAEAPHTLGAGTYYYQAQLIIDEGRLIGRTAANAEVSATIAADQVVVLPIDTSAMERSGQLCVRVYRGTSAGSYDAYVDIHLVAGGRLIDHGETLMGTPWVARTAGGIDTLNNNGLSGAVTLRGENIEVETSAAAPNVGTWVAGDRVVRTTPGDVGVMRNSALLRKTSGTGWSEGTDYIWSQTFTRDVGGTTLGRRVTAPPASASATGTLGDYHVTATFRYDCIATNTWVRSSVATW